MNEESAGPIFCSNCGFANRRCKNKMKSSLNRRCGLGCNSHGPIQTRLSALSRSIFLHCQPQRKSLIFESIFNKINKLKNIFYVRKYSKYIHSWLIYNNSIQSQMIFSTQRIVWIIIDSAPRSTVDSGFKRRLLLLPWPGILERESTVLSTFWDQIPLTTNDT